MTITEDERQLGPAVRTLLGGTEAWIGGDWEAPEGTESFPILNPTTGANLLDVRSVSVEQVQRAVGAARHAFDDGPWASSTPRHRSDLLRALAEVVDRHRDELTELIITEVGAPVRLARAMQVGMPVANIAWAADMALKGPVGGYEEALLPHDGPPASSSILRREPVGVVAAITGYNFPINSVVWKLAPALAAGCSIVIKPSPRTPLAALAMMRLVDQVGFPPGVVNFVFGGEEAGSALVDADGVDLVMFTGSFGVGRSVMKQAAESTKRVVLELGGKSASIVLDGADIDHVVAETTLRFCRLAGQACGATTRTLVPRSIYDEFAASSRAFLDALPVGDPRLETTEIGPLIRAEHRDFVESRLNAALERGATLVGGAGRPAGFDDGFFMNAAMVGNVTNADPICREELFGPVGTLIPYDTVDEAVRIANDSDYGLHAAVFGAHQPAMAVARRLRTGSVAVNGGGFMRPESPWGGVKRSGFGREMGDEGFREFFEVKHIQWPIR